ncbi:Urea carboxylase-related ABC transporter [Klebsiella variicola]|nr:Urea carboxylase-related ABC transporter [Klebsiella variicola]
MQRVAQFSFDKGLLGEGAQSADFIGMTFPGNVTLGDAANRKLRFDDSYLKLAAAGQL